jgi:hypothetical protein
VSRAIADLKEAEGEALARDRMADRQLSPGIGDIPVPATTTPHRASRSSNPHPISATAARRQATQRCRPLGRQAQAHELSTGLQGWKDQSGGFLAPDIVATATVNEPLEEPPVEEARPESKPEPPTDDALVATRA